MNDETDFKIQEAERDFWGLHEFQDAWDTLGCRRCGGMFHDLVHQKETNEPG